MEEDLAIQSAMNGYDVGAPDAGMQADFQASIETLQAQGIVEPHLNKIEENPIEFAGSPQGYTDPRMA